MSQPIARRLVVDVEGVTLSDRDRELLRMFPVGGVILFSRNYESPAQLTLLTKAIREVRQDLVIFVDQEGGRVQRFNCGFSRLPAAARYGALYDNDAEAAMHRVAGISMLGISELLDAGVDCNFAPVLDIDRGLNNVIGDRAYHRNCDTITLLAGKYCDAAAQLGMRTVAKHFPGHGGVREDTHTEVACDERDYDAIWQQDIKPFRALAKRLDAMMTTHVRFPSIDEKAPTFSNIWLRRILREEVGFDGVIFSDDLTMHGASVRGSLADRSELALRAGVDVAVLCNDFAAIDTAVESLAIRCDVPSDFQPIKRMAANWQYYAKAKATYAPAIAEARAALMEMNDATKG